MNYSKRLIGYREFWGTSNIQALIKTSKHFDSKSENVHSAESLIIFSTSKQQTWLVTTEKRLYCILDDIRKPKPRVQWSSPKEKLLEPNQITTRPKSNKSGLINLGDDHKNWLYSKKLFKNAPIESSVKKLLSG